MALISLRGQRQQQGIRPFDPAHDLKAVADLMVAAFGDQLDASGQATLAHMRRMARVGMLMGKYYWLSLDSGEVAPGFVWVEDGRTVGNVSLRRVAGEPAYLIGNVAVHPDWQRRGIATALIEAALESVSRQGTRWVGLEVRTDNPNARRLYERLGFSEIGQTWTMTRPAGLDWQRRAAPVSVPLRRARVREANILLELARESIPAPQHAFFELRRESYRLDLERKLNHLLEGRREVWWVATEGQGKLLGAVRARCERRSLPHRLEVLVRSRCEGQLETGLVARGLDSLPRVSDRAVEVTVPVSLQALVASLRQAGFETAYGLVQMRLDLRGRSRSMTVRANET